MKNKNEKCIKHGMWITPRLNRFIYDIIEKKMTSEMRILLVRAKLERSSLKMEQAIRLMKWECPAIDSMAVRDCLESIAHEFDLAKEKQ